jgi:hypothetical protein
MTKTRYLSLVAAVERAINDADPIGLLEGGAPADEYSSEIGTIVPRVVNVQSADEIISVLHEEFLRWFGKETAGPRHAYEAPARHIWGAVLEFRRSADSGTPG